MRPHSQAAKTSPSHGEGVGSIPAGVTKRNKSELFRRSKLVRICFLLSAWQGAHRAACSLPSCSAVFAIDAEYQTPPGWQAYFLQMARLLLIDVAIRSTWKDIVSIIGFVFFSNYLGCSSAKCFSSLLHSDSTKDIYF